MSSDSTDPIPAVDVIDAGLDKLLIKSRSQQQLPPWPKQPPQSAIDDIGMEYTMTNNSRGFCLIFNQVEFDHLTGQPSRDGSDVDAANLERTFRRLEFDVRAFRNLRATQLTEIVREFRTKDHSASDCIALVLLSHGYDGYFYAKDRQLSIDWLIKQFRPDSCPSLAGKPKLVFIQACRGDSFDPGVEVIDSGDDVTDAKEGAIGSGPGMRVPLESDFFVFYSTPPGYFSWRNSQRGSWFVQQLTAVLDRHGDKLEMQHLAMLVQRLVATDYASDTGERASTGMKQMPVTVSQLRKLLFFRQKRS